MATTECVRCGATRPAEVPPRLREFDYRRALDEVPVSVIDAPPKDAKYQCRDTAACSHRVLVTLARKALAYMTKKKHTITGFAEAIEAAQPRAVLPPDDGDLAAQLFERAAPVLGTPRTWEDCRDKSLWLALASVVRDVVEAPPEMEPVPANPYAVNLDID